MSDTNPIIRDRFGNPTNRTMVSDANAKRAPVPKFFVRLSDGVYLANFHMVLFTQHGDDPSCWSDDIKHAKRYTGERIEKMRAIIEMFQGKFEVIPS